MKQALFVMSAFPATLGAGVAGPVRLISLVKVKYVTRDGVSQFEAT